MDLHASSAHCTIQTAHLEGRFFVPRYGRGAAAAGRIVPAASPFGPEPFSQGQLTAPESDDGDLACQKSPNPPSSRENTPIGRESLTWDVGKRPATVRLKRGETALELPGTEKYKYIGSPSGRWLIARPDATVPARSP